MVVERVPVVLMRAYEDIIGPRGFCFEVNLADLLLTTSGERMTLPVNVSCAPHVDIQEVQRKQPYIGIEFNYHAYSECLGQYVIRWFHKKYLIFVLLRITSYHLNARAKEGFEPK